MSSPFTVRAVCVAPATAVSSLPGFQLALDDGWRPSVRDQAARRWQRHDRVRTMCPKTGATTIIDVVAHPRAPAEALGGVGSVGRLNHASPVDSRQSAQLLSDDLGLQPALRSEIDVLEVAASAHARTGDLARRSDPIRTGPQNLHRICPPETIMAVVGDPDQHLLTRQGVPDEYHPALVPSDAVSAVGDRAHLDRAQQSPLPRALRRTDPSATRPARRVGGSQSAAVATRLAPQIPTGRVLTRGLPRSRCSALLEDLRRYGTEVTMTPGVKSKRPFNRSALWLCRICSHQRPTTYSGM